MRFAAEYSFGGTNFCNSLFHNFKYLNFFGDIKLFNKNQIKINTSCLKPKPYGKPRKMFSDFGRITLFDFYRSNNGLKSVA